MGPTPGSALIIAVADIHSAIHKHFETEPRASPKLQNPNASSLTVGKFIQLDAADLVDVTNTAE